MSATIPIREDLVPYSTATNADELLADVVRVILEEPARMNMSSWALLQDSLARQILACARYEWSTEYHAAAPACGTVGCVAGWVVFLHDHEVLKEAEQPEERLATIPERAAVILGFDPLGADGIHSRALVSGPSLWHELFTACIPALDDFKPGTREYANVVVARILEFRARHQERLLAQPVHPRRPEQAGA